MSERFLSSQALSSNSQKFLAYALLGYLHRLLAHGTFGRMADQSCLTPSLCLATKCGKCRPVNEDAFGIFGVTPIFDAAEHPDMPPVLKEILLSLDEYEILDRSAMQPMIEQHIEQLLAYLTSVPENDQSMVRPIFKLFATDKVRYS
jgi:hypothetical protein